MSNVFNPQAEPAPIPEPTVKEPDTASSFSLYQHVDPEKHLIGETLPAPSRIITTGAATIGTSPIAAREDHFHGATSTTDLDPFYVNVTGDTMTGTLTINNSGQAIVLQNASAYLAFYNGATWLGYLQGITNGVLLRALTGLVYIQGIGGISLSPATINGYTLSESTLGNRLVCSNSSGYINGNYINMTADVNGGWPAYIAGQNGDNYLRWWNKAGALVTTRHEGSANAYFYADAALMANPGTGYACCSLHPGGIAITMCSPAGVGNMLYIRDYNFNGTSANIAAANFSSDSSRRWKKNINPYPLQPVGAGVPRVTDLLSQLKPVTYEPKVVDAEILDDRRMKAFQRLNEYRANREIEAYELPEHDCSIHECNGTAEDPCCRVVNRRRQLHGFIAEDVYEVFPEVVHLDAERLPSGIDINQLLSISIAAIQELVERVKILEGVSDG